MHSAWSSLWLTTLSTRSDSPSLLFSGSQARVLVRRLQHKVDIIDMHSLPCQQVVPIDAVTPSLVSRPPARVIPAVSSVYVAGQRALLPAYAVQTARLPGRAAVRGHKVAPPSRLVLRFAPAWECAWSVSAAADAIQAARSRSCVPDAAPCGS